MILDELTAHARERLAAYRSEIPDDQMLAMARALPRGGDFPFEAALRKPGLSFICEIKHASPSKGVISPDFPYLVIAGDYVAGGADAISVLTEPKWFLGGDGILKELAGLEPGVPLLRKDFIVDPYMVAQAKCLGANAVLLITSILTDQMLKDCLSLADELGLSALVEAHTEEQVRRALACGARVIGVNNRNLEDFTVDPTTTARLRGLVPPGVLFVSESGVHSVYDLWRAQQAGCDGVLIGEVLMRAPHPEQRILGFRRMLRPYPSPRIKICGVRRMADIHFANQYRPDMVGFVFAGGSKRRISYDRASTLRRILDPKIDAVGVFVDTDPDQIIWLLDQGIIQYAQLHGHEPDSDIRRIQDAGYTVFRAFQVQTEDDVKAAEQSPADLIVLDAGAGCGRAFPWELALGCERPYILAGGLTPENVKKAIARLHPWGVDVSSGVETNGTKSESKIKTFMKEARHAANNESTGPVR